jgi:hypothetical protein
MALQRVGAQVWHQRASIMGALRPACLTPSCLSANPEINPNIGNARRETHSDSVKLNQAAQVQTATSSTLSRAPLLFTSFEPQNASSGATTTTSKVPGKSHVDGRSAASSAAEHALQNPPRFDWTKAEVQAIFDSPLMDLLFHGVSLCRHIT